MGFDFDPTVHLYTIIEFILPGKKPVNRTDRLEIVPTKWLDFNPATKKCYVLYPKNIEDKAVVAKFHKLVKNLGEPLEEYGIYIAKPIGKASKYLL